MGGSQRILMEVLDALAESGHEVRALSPIEDGVDSFRTSHGAAVEPSLELRGSFPVPYQTAPHRLASVWESIRDAAEWADRVYLHADAIYMRGALGDLPIVRSLHDFVYEEALLSAFTLPADRTIVPSVYMRDCIAASAGSVSNVGELRVVSNGIAAQPWPVEPALPSGVGPRGDSDLILLHPHRLHREKGIEESIAIAAGVQAELPDRNVRLLVPGLAGADSADDANLEAASISEFAREARAESLLELHQWMPLKRMPGYLAAGDVTLCPGSFVEAFGLVPLESVVAGTPAVCSRVGAFREQEGIDGILHHDYGDIRAAVEAVVQLVRYAGDSAANASAVADRFDLGMMRANYVEAITGPLPNRSDHRQPESPAGPLGWKLAPWCYVSERGIYHDYLARFEEVPQLARLLRSGDGSVAQNSSTNPEETAELERARKSGFIVPV